MEDNIIVVKEVVGVVVGLIIYFVHQMN